MSARKARIVSHPALKRRKPSHADYCDEISDQVLSEIQRVASSKDKDERWEVIHERAW